jgi:hypothetical protein
MIFCSFQTFRGPSSGECARERETLILAYWHQDGINLILWFDSDQFILTTTCHPSFQAPVFP